jgi:predicted transcriptional regulator
MQAFRRNFYAKGFFNFKKGKRMFENESIRRCGTVCEPFTGGFIIERPSIDELMGHQKNIMDFLFYESKAHNGDRIFKFNNKSLSQLVGIKYKIIQIGIKRLVDKGFLIRHEGKKGRGGFSIMEIPEKVFEQMKGML